MKKIEIFVGSDSAFEKIIPQKARNLTELATQLDDDNKKMEMNVIIPGQPKPKTQKKRKPIVRNLVIHADEYCSVQEHVIIRAHFYTCIFQCHVSCVLRSCLPIEDSLNQGDMRNQDFGQGFPLRHECLSVKYFKYVLFCNK